MWYFIMATFSANYRQPQIHFNIMIHRHTKQIEPCQTYNRTLAINWHTGKLQSIIMTRLQAQKSQPWGYTTTSPVSHTLIYLFFLHNKILFHKHYIILHYLSKFTIQFVLWFCQLRPNKFIHKLNMQYPWCITFIRSSTQENI